MNASTMLHWIAANPSIDINLFLGAGGLSLVLEKVLTSLNIDSKKIAFSLLHLFGLLTAFSAWILANISASDAVGIYGALVIVAGFWHRFVISGIYTRDVEPELNKLATGTGIANPTVATNPQSVVAGTHPASTLPTSGS